MYAVNDEDPVAVSMLLQEAQNVVDIFRKVNLEGHHLVMKQ